MRKIPIVIAAVCGMVACSSSNSSTLCQTAITQVDYGDCANLADAGTGQFMLTSDQRSQCVANCTSSSDQTAVTNIFNCFNGIPADAGACSMTNDGWLGYEVQLFITCAGTLNGASANCKGSFLHQIDAG